MADTWAVPPDPEGVSSIQAARLFGCSDSHFFSLMRKYGVTPMRTYQHGRRMDKFWNPAVVLQVAAAHRATKATRRMERAAARHTVSRATLKELSQLRRRQTRLESYRKTLLARIAARTA